MKKSNVAAAICYPVNYAPEVQTVIEYRIVANDRDTLRDAENAMIGGAAAVPFFCSRLTLVFVESQSFYVAVLKI